MKCILKSTIFHGIAKMQLDLFLERFDNYTKPAMILDNEFDKNLRFIYQDRDKYIEMY